MHLYGTKTAGGQTATTSHHRGVTGIKLHYIRLLAWLERRLRGTAPANNPTEQRAHILHYIDFLHAVFCRSFGPLFHSFLLTYPFFHLHCRPSSFFLSYFLPLHLWLFLSLGESDASYFPPAFWDQPERRAEKAVLPKSVVVLIECIILLMFCHCCCTLQREAQCRNVHVCAVQSI